MSAPIDENEIDDDYEDEVPPVPEDAPPPDPWSAIVPMFGKAVAMPRQPRCIVCQQEPEIRGVIEAMCYMNYSYKQIYEHLPDGCPVVMTKDGTRRTNLKNFRTRIARHFGRGGKKHQVSHSSFSITMAFQVRDAVDKALGRDSLNDDRLGLAYQIAFLLDWCKQCMFDGTMKAPSPKDYAFLAQMLEGLLNPTGPTKDAQMFREVMNVLMPEMMKILPQATLQAFVSALEGNPLFVEAYERTLALPPQT